MVCGIGTLPPARYGAVNATCYCLGTPGSAPEIGLWLDAFHPADRDRILDSQRQTFEAHSPLWSCEFRLRRRDGTYANVLCRGAVLYDAKNNPVRMVGGTTDLTEIKRGQHSEARLAAIVSGSYDAIRAQTLDGVITDWNEASTRLYGYTAAEAIGQSVSMLVPPDNPTRMATVLEKIRQGESVQLEAKTRRKDGTLVDIALTASPIKDSNGRRRRLFVDCSRSYRPQAGRRGAASEARRNTSPFCVPPWMVFPFWIDRGAFWTSTTRIAPSSAIAEKNC